LPVRKRAFSETTEARFLSIVRDTRDKKAPSTKGTKTIRDPAIKRYSGTRKRRMETEKDWGSKSMRQKEHAHHRKKL